MDLHKLAYNIVNRSMNIGMKDNPEFLKMKKKYPWMKGTFTLQFASEKLKKNVKAAEKFLGQYEKLEYGPLLIKKNGKYVVKEKIGQVIKILYHPDNKLLALAVRDECWKNGAFTIMEEGSMESQRRMFSLHSEESLHELPKVMELIEENTDMTIHLETRDWSAWSKGIPDEKVQARRAASMRIHEINDRNNKPWVLVGWPHKKNSDERGFPFQKLERIMFDCIEYSYSEDSKKLVGEYSKAFAGKSEIRITADDGTDLKLSIKGRRLLTDVADYDVDALYHGDVGKNIPTGEVFFAPVETSANGKLVIPASVIPGEGVAENLVLYFKDGVVVKNTASKGSGMLDAFIGKNGKDSDRVAELGIGLNKKAEFTRGEIIIDEKVFGSIHVAIGWNVGFGGKTNAASHLDFIKDLRGCNGKLFADGKLLLDCGKLVR